MDTTLSIPEKPLMGPVDKVLPALSRCRPAGPPALECRQFLRSGIWQMSKRDSER